MSFKSVESSESESVYLYCATNGEIALPQQQNDSGVFKNNNNRENKQNN